MLKIILLLSFYFIILANLCAQKLAHLYFNQLAKIEPILYDYSYNKKNKKVINKTNQQQLDTEIDPQLNYIAFEEWGADNAQTFIKIVALRNKTNQAIYAVLKHSFSDIQAQAVICFWRLENKQWAQVTAELLPYYENLQVIDYQDCAPNIKREAKSFPLCFELDNAQLLLRYKADMEAANAFCIYQKAEDNTGGEIPVCAVLNCANFYLVEWVFDPLICKFERLK